MTKNEKLATILNPIAWETVSRNLLTKMIAEFMYEDILSPTLLEKKEGRNRYVLPFTNGIRYHYEAKERGVFDSYRVFSDTIQREEDGTLAPASNPIRFLLDMQGSVPMSPETTAHLIREYHNTLIADAHILLKKQSSTVDVTDLDYAELEGEMDGHPWITYNKGRIGFNYDDYLNYAPENQQRVQISWIALHRERTDLHTVQSVDFDTLLRQELSDSTMERFNQRLQAENGSRQDYLFMPIHEWQWKQMIVPLFAEDLATRKIIYLGQGDDWYLPQQSVRTFVNVSHKEKHHVKLPMSILNTLVYRGLPGERTVLAPKITDYIKGIYEQDAFLKEECRVVLPGEIASLNYDHPYFTDLPGVPYHYLEMLGAIWRESVYTYLDEGEKPITLAALLHVDHNNTPLVSKLIARSGLSVEEWVQRLTEVILPPLLRFLYRYGVVFSPHGQNTILILKDSIPHRLAIKDFVDDVNVSDQPLPELADIPADLKKVLRSEPPEGLCQFIFTGLFICHFRYLSDLLNEHEGLSEITFWSQVRKTILRYQEEFPEESERFQLFDLLQPLFTKLCLNRNRMLDYGYGDDGDRPHASEHGTVTNILAEVAHIPQT
ncbi:IucA/IucC family protein [Marininema halotolerans]|uniref:Siderophore synthetase component n=1 Tax=Marininema halotolerans TaxID=1155944 RepID=A0A1I6R0V1_9BACL|nr:IucA/IucC family siderophore biosynthesis protein [Marininema halotolerans]SFS58240.1 Siderophore synthetase component [Marininema halotolerans]